MSDFFGLKWGEVDSAGKQVSVLRSNVKQQSARAKQHRKTPVPLDPRLVRLFVLGVHGPFPATDGLGSCQSCPPWEVSILGRAVLRHYIRPATVKVGITKWIGWHTFQHSYSTLMKASGADIKVMQELPFAMHLQVTLDTYTQAVTPAKRAAQTGGLRVYSTRRDNARAFFIA